MIKLIPVNASSSSFKNKNEQNNNIKKYNCTHTSLWTNLVLLTEASSATRNSCSVVHNQAETADKPHLRLIS